MQNGTRRSPRRDKGQGPLTLAELARLRQAVYRLLSQCLLYPDAQRLPTIATAAGEMNRLAHVWNSFAFFHEWSHLLHRLEELRYREPSAIQDEYLSSFVVNSAGLPCPIYESAYLGDDPSAAGWLLAQLEGEYAQVGLSTSLARREPPDHAAVELEFMAFLCRREAEAWEAEALPQALASLQRQRSFAKHHLACWFPQFARRATAHKPDSIFAAVGQAARAFLAHDSDLLDSLQQRFESVAEAP